jgi:hypothetical protein
MAKPINLFQGPAPSAMSQMGAGLVEAGQSIGNAWGNAYRSIGQSIGQGLQTLGGSIGQKMQENKDAEAMNKMFDMTLKSPTLSSQLLGIPDDAAGREMRDSLMNQKRDIIKEYGLSGAQQFFKGIIQPLENIGSEERQLKNRISLQGMQEAGAMSRLQEQLNQQRESEMLKYLSPAKTKTAQPFPSSGYNIAPSPSFGRSIRMTLGEQ